jgi:hypothetical protein
MSNCRKKKNEIEQRQNPGKKTNSCFHNIHLMCYHFFTFRNNYQAKKLFLYQSGEDARCLIFIEMCRLFDQIKFCIKHSVKRQNFFAKGCFACFVFFISGR